MSKLALLGTGVQTIGNALGINSANKAQERMMGIQYGNQRKLNKQGQDLQMQTWRATNYPAQIEMMKKAGLNPSLMYAQGGQGGTTGSQGGGSATGGNQAGPKTIDISAMMMDAQINLMKAQAKKAEEEAIEKELDNETKKTYGQDADKYEASNRRDRALQEGQYLYDALQGSETNKSVNSNFLKTLDNEVAVGDVERRIKEETEKDVKQKVAYELYNLKVEKALKESKIDLTREQERKLWHDIWQGWTNAGLKGLDSIIKGRLKDIGKGKK